MWMPAEIAAFVRSLSWFWGHELSHFAHRRALGEHFLAIRIMAALYESDRDDDLSPERLRWTR